MGSLSQDVLDQGKDVLNHVLEQVQSVGTSAYSNDISNTKKRKIQKNVNRVPNSQRQDRVKRADKKEKEDEDTPTEKNEPINNQQRKRIKLEMTSPPPLPPPREEEWPDDESL